jgi:hypothetical protein
MSMSLLSITNGVSTGCDIERSISQCSSSKELGCDVGGAVCDVHISDLEG